MERLTRKETIVVRGKETAACNYENDDCNDQCRYGTCRWQEKANMILKEYEDTGLTPEQIRELLSCENASEITRSSRDNDGWIPVEERLPEKGERVLCFFEFEPISPNVICENGYIGSGIWLSEGDKVVAWRPLPEPYKAERSSNEEE